MLTSTPSNDLKRNDADKWYECVICGPARLYVRLGFSSASVEPTLGETITGATSGHTGVVDRIHLFSGAYTTGDAVGEVLLLSPTGYDIGTQTCFEEGEVLNGSVAGDAFASVDAETPGLLSRSGRLYREGDTIVRDNKRYCSMHYHYHWDKRSRQESEFSIDEGDRETPTT